MIKRNSMRTVVFGAFDGLHPGHIHFLQEACKDSDDCIAIIARDETIKALKQKTPIHAEKERIHAVKSLPYITNAILGDAELGTYSCLTNLQPDRIAIGYDQEDLEKDLQNYLKNTGKKIVITRIKPYKEHIYKSSLLNPYD